MAYVIIEGYDGGTPLPTKEDGSKWVHALLHGEHLFLADTAVEIIALAFVDEYELIPDTQEGDEEALLARYTVATQCATMAQVSKIREYTDAGGDFTELDEEVVNAAFTPRIQPIPLDGPTWNGPFTLVGIATNYVPYRPGLKPPKGDVVLIDPYTDTTLLSSLSAAGVCSYRLHESST